MSVTTLARRVNIGALIACDTREDMRQGHARALRALVNADPTLVFDATLPNGHNITRSKQHWTPDRIRTIRERLGMDHNTFALHTNVTVATVRNWERGSWQPDKNTWKDLLYLEAEALEME